MEIKQKNKHVIANCEAVKQSRFTSCVFLDCFVISFLAMTNTHKNLISTLFQQQNSQIVSNRLFVHFLMR
jgi:hypothetical protein